MNTADDVAGGSTERADFLGGVHAAFSRACRSGALERISEFNLRLAGHPVRMQVAGSDLAEILYRCFEPRVEANIPTGRAALSIRAWDRTTTGVGCPGIPFAPDVTDVLGPGLMSQYDRGRVLRYERSEIVKCLDRATGEVFVCVRDAKRLRLNDRTKPFPHFLATWCLDHGVQLLHAGAVSRKGRGMLFGGEGGSGKSTCVIACALAGFDCLGDDTVGTSLATNGTIAYACYNAMRCDARILDWFPTLRSVSMAPAHPAEKNKSLVYLSDVCSASIVSQTSIAAIVVTEVRGTGASTIVPASKAATLRRLAPSTLFRGLGAGSAGFSHIAELVRRHPCYELQMGATPADVPDLIDRTLEDLTR